MSLNADENSYLTFCPANGGYRVSVEITPFDNEKSAKNALQKNKKSFKSVTRLDDGFEAELTSAWYCCKTSDRYLIEVWYSLPKKTNTSLKSWNALKNCIALEIENPEPELDATDRPAVEKTPFSWVFHHPENKVDVFFKTTFRDETNQNGDPSQSYLINFCDWEAKGYFYIKWDQDDVSSEEPYAKHLEEMWEDVVKIDPTVQKSGKPTFDLKNGFAYSVSPPYLLITVHGDGFLFGFACQNKIKYVNFDVNDLVKKISWTVK